MRKAHEFSLVRAYNLCMRHCVRGVSSANAIYSLNRKELRHSNPNARFFSV